MKEVTYEEWQKNPTPRVMWVWDNLSDVKKKAKVICVAKGDFHLPVMTVAKDYAGYCSYRHCAEIEEQRRMTNQELAWWLLDGIKEGKHREWSYNFLNDLIVHSYIDYTESARDKLVDNDILIRENGGEWKEPLVNCSMAKQERLTETRQEIKEMRNRIAELEKENAELKSEFDMLKTSEY